MSAFALICVCGSLVKDKVETSSPFILIIVPLLPGIPRGPWGPCGPLIFLVFGLGKSPLFVQEIFPSSSTFGVNTGPGSPWIPCGPIGPSGPWGPVSPLSPLGPWAIPLLNEPIIIP